MKRLFTYAAPLVALAITVLCSVSSASSIGSASTGLETKGPVRALAADGARAALVVHTCRAGALCSDSEGCTTVRVWAPASGRSARLEHTCPDGFMSTDDVALARARAAWLESWYGTTVKETVVMTATRARPKPVQVAYESTSEAYGPYGNTALAPVGDGQLLVFTVETRCESTEKGGDGPPCPPDRKDGDVIAATIWRLPGTARCPSYPIVRRCARVAEETSELTALAVDGGRIVVRTSDGVSVMTPTGRHLRDLAVEKVRAAALSGDRLALRIPGAIEIYDAGSGTLIGHVPVSAQARLEDLEDGVLVTAVKKTVNVRRLVNGRVTTIHTRGVPHAQLEPSGLFVAGGRHLTFTPMSQVLRQLGGRG
jgi:hypothetical protein